jgi:hypothetical protein
VKGGFGLAPPFPKGGFGSTFPKGGLDLKVDICNQSWHNIHCIQFLEQ